MMTWLHVRVISWTFSTFCVDASCFTLLLNHELLGSTHGFVASFTQNSLLALQDVMKSGERHKHLVTKPHVTLVVVLSAQHWIRDALDAFAVHRKKLHRQSIQLIVYSIHELDSGNNHSVRISLGIVLGIYRFIRKLWNDVFHARSTLECSNTVWELTNANPWSKLTFRWPCVQEL